MTVEAGVLTRGPRPDSLTPMDAHLYDMDGTLADVRGIRHYVEGETRNFDKFHKESVNCPPNAGVVAATHQSHADGFKVLIVTARQEIYDIHTSWWLLLNDVYFDDMYMRRAGDFRPDYVVKKEILAKIRRDGYNPVKAWEDNPNVVKLWEENSLEIVLVEGFGFDGHSV